MSNFIKTKEEIEKDNWEVYNRPFWSKNTYDHKARWLNFHTQINAIAKMIRREGGLPFEVLEVGTTQSKLIQNYLKQFGVTVKTLDLKDQYNPDFLCSIVKTTCLDNSFDAVIACEILEHTTWEEFKQSLYEIHRITRKYAFITLPDVGHTLISLYIKIPFLKPLTIFKKIPNREPMPKRKPGAHQWEINRPETSPQKVRKEMEQAGFKVLEQFVNQDAPKNHCFLLLKEESKLCG